MKILVADDEENVRNFLGSLLTTKGHKVLMSGCGNSTLKVISAEKIDLVFLDYQMPDTNGLQVVEQLTSIKKKVKVILMSGHDITKLENEFSKHKNIIGFLPKPFELEDLKMCLQDVEISEETNR